MAAVTRSGARTASEIVMLTFRMLHRSRLAMRFPHLRSRRQEVRRASGGLAQSMRLAARGSPSVSDERVAAKAPRAEESPDAALTVSCATGHLGCCRRQPSDGRAPLLGQGG